MPAAWRLIKTKYLATAWDGEGAQRSGGRWNGVGTAVVYVAGTLSLALLETLVHTTSDLLPAYTAVPIEFDESLVTTLDEKDLPRDWMSAPAPVSTRAIGDEWVKSARSALLRVPSVVVPLEYNYVMNPTHPDFGRIRIGAAMRFPFDQRLRFK